jgi:6-phosphofructokinase 1
MSFVKSKASKKICLLNGGGDCPGLNAVIRAATKTAILDYGWQIWGSEDSFDGFIQPKKMVPLTLSSTRGILSRGGTILGTTNRGNPFKYPVKNKNGQLKSQNYSQQIIKKFKELALDALIVVGGDGTLSIGHHFFQAGLPIIGVPKTIDNDLLATEVSFGFNTAVQTATEAIDKVHTTAASHNRVMIVEVMGRNAGWIALEAGISGGVDIILIPEIPFHIKKIGDKLKQRTKAGRLSSIIVVAEGAAPFGKKPVYLKQKNTEAQPRLGGIGFAVGNMIQQHYKIDTRVVVLGHLQRGGSPTPFDRLLGTRFGMAAVKLVAQNSFGHMVSLQCGRIESVPIKKAIAHQRLIDPSGELVKTAKAIGISFGD